jgi:hypothetical protein
MKLGVSVCIAIWSAGNAFAQTPSPGATPKTVEELREKYPQLKDVENEMIVLRAVAQTECIDRLDAEDPTVEWKRISSEWKDNKWVVSRYGTRNLAMVTGVCHVTMKGRKVVSMKTWVK